MFHTSFTDNSRHLGQTCSDSLSGLSYDLFYSAGLTNFICRDRGYSCPFSYATTTNVVYISDS